MRVTAPDGRIWDVHRRFRRPRWRWPDAPDPLEFIVGSVDIHPASWILGPIVGLVAFVVVTALIFVLLPPILFLLELLVVAFALATTIRPWLVVAETNDESHEWKVRGWLKSRQAIRQVTRQLRAGVPLQETWR